MWMSCRDKPDRGKVHELPVQTERRSDDITCDVYLNYDNDRGNLLNYESQY